CAKSHYSNYDVLDYW
nr:immunoglobulin heavy chain junction region [Mus musculus]NSM04646.1 immunoglobulin heavy chain junction region [Mus musculus]NSM04743.1 immunoglobulin heavy chain junction region [Mus musculus]NSM04962.1 immunoglobulin heavy chain junction region [Mus musculus]NSM05128.1 immunoglobulin heavy chain junction region [Mus musculus]